MPDLLAGKRLPGPCPFCGGDRPVAGVYVVHEGKQRRRLAACGLCLGRMIDVALGWHLSNQILQATVAREAAAAARVEFRAVNGSQLPTRRA